MNYQRLYEYRFRDVDQSARTAVWHEIAPFIHGLMGHPQTVLDPAAGRGEFINAVPAQERWAIDQVAYAEGTYRSNVRSIVSDIFEADLPAAHFDGVFVSNFLEHLLDPGGGGARSWRGCTTPWRRGGRIAIMGPNFRYCAREYFDWPTTRSSSPTGRSPSTSTRPALSRSGSSRASCRIPSPGGCRRRRR